MDFFWPAAWTFARMVSEGAGTRCLAKMWCSKWASPTRMDEAQKRCWAQSSRLRYSSSPIARFLCSSLFSGNGLQFLQLLRRQLDSFSFKGGGRNLRCFGLGQDA